VRSLPSNLMEIIGTQNRPNQVLSLVCPIKQK
jgi:hypothetical protein